MSTSFASSRSACPNVKAGSIKAYGVSAASVWRRCRMCRPQRSRHQLRDEHLGRTVCAEGRAADVVAQTCRRLDERSTTTACRCGSTTLGGSIPAKRERTPAAFDKYVKDEIARWAPVLKEAAEPGSSASSIHRQPARLDRARPFVDLGSDELAEILPTPALRPDRIDAAAASCACFTAGGIHRSGLAACSLATIGAGVPFGMKNAAQFAASKPCRPCSCAVGTFGRLAARALDSTAIALI